MCIRDRPSGHWVASWLSQVEALEVEVERWPQRPFALDDRPVKVFLGGRLALRLRASPERVHIEFLTGSAPSPTGFTARGSSWEASFTQADGPGDDTLNTWLRSLARFAGPAEAPADAAPPEDDAYYWLWDHRARLTDRTLYDRDRRPFSEYMRRAFGRMTDDEQALLRAQWQRELMEEGPTVAETLGWSGKQVMDTYRSAMTQLKRAATRYERPRRPRR